MMFATDGQDDSDITVPVVQIGPFNASNVFRAFTGSYMIVNLTSDGNKWRDIYQSNAMIFAQVFVTATGLVYASLQTMKLSLNQRICEYITNDHFFHNYLLFRVAALAVWKAVIFLHRYRFQYKIPLLCLLLDFLACVGL
jgi:hypothetical protein